MKKLLILAAALLLTGCTTTKTESSSNFDKTTAPVTAGSGITLKPSGSGYVMCADLVEGITNPDYWLSGTTSVGFGFSTNAYCYNATYGWQFADKLDGRNHDHFIRFEGSFSSVKAIDVTLTNFNMENYFLENEEYPYDVTKIEANMYGTDASVNLYPQPLVNNIVSVSGNTCTVRYNIQSTERMNTINISLDTFTQALAELHHLILNKLK